MSPNRVLSIQYASGLTIDDPKTLATLCVFYDETILPFRPALDKVLSIMALGDRNAGALARGVRNWNYRWKLLFDEGVLRRTEHFEKLQSDDSFVQCLEAVQEEDEWEDWLVAFSAATSQETAPFFFTEKNVDTTTSRLSANVLRAFFEHRLPQLGELKAEQILEVREAISDTRTAFRHYLNGLVDDTEERMRSGESEIIAATKTLERKVLGQYDEFLRQLKYSRYRRCLDVSKSLLRVAAQPTKPERWGEFAIEIGKALGANDRSNKAQAFEYLARIERDLP